MKNCILLILLVANVFVFSQDDSTKVMKKLKRNVVFGEIGGNGLYGSLNYNRTTRRIGKKVRLSFRLGIAPNTEPRNNGNPIEPLAEIGMLLGKAASYFELGLGASIHSYTETNYSRSGKLLSSRLVWNPYKTLRLGCRFQKPEGGIFYCAALTPVLGENPFTGSSGFLWFGFGMGYCF